MPTKVDLKQRLLAALDGSSAPSSDYDLNTEVTLPADRKLRPAGVLVPIVNRDQNPGLLLTKRAATLRHHPGQIAFPGGKVDTNDAGPTEAALREAQEEIGLVPDEVEVLGSLAPHETVTGFLATPVVALVTPGFAPQPSPDEVAEVFDVPLAHVFDQGNFSVQSRRWRGARRSYFTVPWGPYYIWGATARMLYALAKQMRNDDN